MFLVNNKNGLYAVRQTSARMLTYSPFYELHCQSFHPRETMSTPHSVKQISPMLTVGDMSQTLQFYSEVLGFRVSLDSAEYAIIERDGFTIHLVKAADASVMEAVKGHMQLYIEVSGILSLWEHVQTFHGRYKVRELFDREYGMMEFHIVDPNDCLVFVGERIASFTKSD